MDDWRIKYEEECRLNDIKARKAWKEKYSKLKPMKDRTNKRYEDMTFLDRVVVKENVVETHTTRITWSKDEDTKKTLMSIHSLVSKSQRFLCVNGPLAGQKIEDKDKDYVLYNCSGFNSGLEDNTPRCVLVHKTTLTHK
jgi:hypothetical protein